MYSKLPRRIHIMNRLRNAYDGVLFTTTPTHVNIIFANCFDADIFNRRHDGARSGNFTVALTHVQFDKLYAI